MRWLQDCFETKKVDIDRFVTKIDNFTEKLPTAWFNFGLIVRNFINWLANTIDLQNFWNTWGHSQCLLTWTEVWCQTWSVGSEVSERYLFAGRSPIKLLWKILWDLPWGIVWHFSFVPGIVKPQRRVFHILGGCLRTVKFGPRITLVELTSPLDTAGNDWLDTDPYLLYQLEAVAWKVIVHYWRLALFYRTRGQL